MNILNHVTNSYLMTFRNLLNQFLEWGQWLFFALLTINIIWLALWYAFDRNSFSEVLPDFIKRFFVITLFYSILIHPEWLFSIASSVQVMGKTLTQAPIDPSSIIAQGIAIANKLMLPINNTSLWTHGIASIILLIVYIITLFIFISIALDLALTLIMTTALISISTFFLSFAALNATSMIARQTLDAVLGQCIKLLGLYIVVAAGSQTVLSVESYVPTQIMAFDQYAWIVASLVLFWLIAKQLPMQLARIVSNAVQDGYGMHSASNLAFAAQKALRVSSTLAKGAAVLPLGVGRFAGSLMYSGTQHYKDSKASTGNTLSALGAGFKGASKDAGSAVMGNISDHFKQLGSKMVGNRDTPRVKGISERLYQSAKERQVRRKAGENK